MDQAYFGGKAERSEIMDVSKGEGSIAAIKAFATAAVTDD